MANETPSARIPLGRGRFALVDAADFDELSQFNWFWYQSATSNTPYALRSAGKGKAQISMHRHLMGLPETEVDHRNGDGLDNRRLNLRLSTRAQNAQNLRKRKNALSRFKGVSPARARWKARIQKDGENIRLGYFTSEQEAAREYDKAAMALFGEFARTNEMLGLYE